MPRLQRCHQGHQFEVNDEATECPLCAQSATILPGGSSVSETRSIPAPGVPPQDKLETGTDGKVREPEGQTATALPSARPAAAPGAGSATDQLPGNALTDTLLPAATAPAAAQVRQIVPGYEMLGILGRGGMGIVYKALQTRLNRLVALKMMLAGDQANAEEVTRFQIEAQAVAQLQHPNIVQIYEVGEHLRRAYFSLEFVDGGSLDKRVKGKVQPPREAAQLVETLARAIHVAHERGIIHRDLKPANVLLQRTEQPALRDRSGKAQPANSDALSELPLSAFVPKITDFGLAKRLEEDLGQTRTGAIMGTPSYMAPEQAAEKGGKIGPAADIYALGAILYELLTAGPPFKGETILDTLHQLLHREPISPARLQPKVPRDLDTICLKCLEKEPAKRYASAYELAEDLHRFLASEPIRARPTAVWERAWKWSRRRPAAASLIAVSVVIGLALMVGGPWVAAREMRRAKEEESLRLTAEKDREHAEENFKQARAAVDEMLTRVGQEKLANEPHMEQVRRDLLAKALQFYQRFAQEKSDDPAVRWESARAYERVGDVQKMLGANDDAARSYQAGLGLLGELIEQDPARQEYQIDLAVCHNNLGILLQETGQLTQAEVAFRNALTIRQKLVESSPANSLYRESLAASLNNLGTVLWHNGRIVDAEPVFRHSLEIHEALTDQTPNNAAYQQELARTLENLAEVLAAKGNRSEAQSDFGRALDVYQKLSRAAPDNPTFRQELASAQHQLGNFWRDNSPKDAETAFRQAIELRTALTLDFPTIPVYRQELAGDHNTLAVLLQAGGRSADAEKSFRQALAVKSKLAEDFPKVPAYRRELADGYGSRAVFLQSHHRPREADLTYRLGLDLLKKLTAEFPNRPEYRQDLARVYLNFGTLQQTTGHTQEAEAAYRDALKIRLDLASGSRLPDRQQDVGQAYLNLGALLRIHGRLGEAENQYLKAREVFSKLAEQHHDVPDYRHQLAVCDNNLGNLQFQIHHTSDAEGSWRQAIELLSALAAEYASVPVYRQDLARAEGDLGVLLGETGRTDEARRTWREALAIQQDLAARFPAKPDYAQELARTLCNMGILLAKLNKIDEAKESFRQSISILGALEKDAPESDAYSADAIVAYTNLARIAEAAGQPKEAEPALQEILRRQEKRAADSPKVQALVRAPAKTLVDLARLKRNAAKSREARAFLEEAVHREREALALDPKEPACRLEFCDYLLQLLEAQARAADHQAAAQTAAEFANAAPPRWAETPRAAGLLAGCLLVVKKDAAISESRQKELTQRYGDHVMELLRQAVAAGSCDIDFLKSAPELGPVRERQDFQALLADQLKKKKSDPK